MDILQICPKPPFPPVDGGAIAMNNLTRGLLGEGHRVKLIATHTYKHGAAEALRDADYGERTGFETEFVDIRLRPMRAFFNLFSTRSYNIERFYSPALEARIVRALKEHEYDVIVLDSLYTARYLQAIRRTTKQKVIYREHNIEYQIWQGTRELERNQLKRAYLKILIDKLRSFEVGMLGKFDGIAAITAADAGQMRALGAEVPIEVIPFGVELQAVRSSAETEAGTVFHLGAMDWLPNQDGIRWFLEQVWPAVRARHPKAKLHLAGRNMPDWLLKTREDQVVIEGEVPSAHDFMQSKAIMVVPLFSGSGMRIKMIEGMALKRPIVTTRLGAQGIEYQPGHHLLLAETSDEFVEAVDHLLQSPDRCAEIGNAAWELVAEQYDNARIARKLVGFCERLAQER